MVITYNPQYFSSQENYTRTPGDGHALLLMEPRIDQRTFSEYQDLVSCFAYLLEVFEQWRVSLGEEIEEYHADKVCKWVESFHRFDLFIYNKQLARYKLVEREEFNAIFMEQLAKLQ